MCPRLSKDKICTILLIISVILGVSSCTLSIKLDGDMKDTAEYAGVIVSERTNVVQVSTGKKFYNVFEYIGEDNVRRLYYANETYQYDVREDYAGVKHLYKPEQQIAHNYLITVTVMIFAGIAFLLTYAEVIGGGGGGLPGGM